MSKLVCGWCGQVTVDKAECDACGRDPRKPYRQRGIWPPTFETPERGRPVLDLRAAHRRVAEAERNLREAGRPVTVEAIAEFLDVTPRTIRRWRK